MKENLGLGVGSDALVIYESSDGSIQLDVKLENDTVWLTANQMASLFGRDEKTVRKHINNVFSDGELLRDINTHFLRLDNVKQPVAFYNLDVIISVGYRVKSHRGVEFRRWATSVLKDYMIKGIARNDRRLEQLGQVVKMLQRVENDLDSHEVLRVVENYGTALNLLDDYDHQCMPRPQGREATYVLTYKECRSVIDSMRFKADSDLFGNEKDGSFKGSIGNIYQTAFGEDVYPSLEEKAANLLYFITKNHSFSDGNKRIAATMFLYFLDKNNALYNEIGEKRIADHTLVALTILAAESKAEEKEVMVSIIMNSIAD